jgi:hypothetical protein
VDGHVSWWRFDTVRGEVIGTGDLGWGQAAEYAMLINTFVVAAGFFYCPKSATNGGKSFVTPGGMKMCIAGAALGMVGVMSGNLILAAVVMLAATIVSGEGGSSP